MDGSRHTTGPKLQQEAGRLAQLTLPDGNAYLHHPWHPQHGRDTVQGYAVMMPWGGKEVQRVSTSTGAKETLGDALPKTHLYLTYGVRGGRFVYGIPWAGSQVLRVDPIAKTHKLVGPKFGSSGGNWHAVNGDTHDGCIYAVPALSADRVLRIRWDVAEGEEEVIDVVGDALTGQGHNKWASGIVGPDGCVYGIPWDASRVLKFDPKTATSTLIGDSFGGRGEKWYNAAVCEGDGCIYAAPWNATSWLKIDCAAGTAQTSESIGGKKIEPPGNWRFTHPAADGWMYATNTNKPSQIMRLDPTTLRHEILTAAVGLETVSRGPKGELYGITPGGLLARVKLNPPPLMSRDKVDTVLQQVLQQSSVPWPYGRVMVRGRGGVGKSSTINAMSGKEFNAKHESTIGADVKDVELHQHDMSIDQSNLNPMQAASGDSAYVDALAFNAAEAARAADDAKAAEAKAKAEASTAAAASAVGAEVAAEVSKPVADLVAGAERDVVDTSTADATSEQQQPKDEAGTASGAIAQPPASDTVVPEAQVPALPSLPDTEPMQLGGLQYEKVQEEEDVPAQPARPKEEDPDKVPADLVIKYRTGAKRQALKLRVQDCGGQTVFLQILDMLITPDGTVHMIVFSLTALHHAFDETITEVLVQLNSVQLCAPDAPVILVGTRKGEVDEAQLPNLSARMADKLRRRCGPAMKGLVPNGQLCFYGIENSKGFHGDQTIVELVGAVERAAKELPSIKKEKVPLKWLRVLDKMRAEAKSRRLLLMRKDAATSGESDVYDMASLCGLPHTGQTLETEVPVMLKYFHTLGAVLWYGGTQSLTSSLGNVVILDPQWVIDAATCVIRQFDEKSGEDSSKGMHHKDVDVAVNRSHREEFTLLKEKGKLSRSLLIQFWKQEEFKDHVDGLLDLMLELGLFVAERAIDVHGKVAPAREANHFIVPALLPDPVDSEPPRGVGEWPRPREDAAELRLHFANEDDIVDDSTLIHDSSKFEAGFLPDGVFHYICTGAVASHTSKFKARVERSHAYVAFDKELVTLQKLSAQSSIRVRLHSNGESGGSIVVDQLRVLIYEALQEYRRLNFKLRCVMLAPLPGKADVWVDLDVLGKISASDTVVHAAPGRQIEIPVLKASLARWLTKQCQFCFILADKLRESSPSFKMVRLQDMPPDWVECRTITFEDACLGVYTSEYVAVSQ